MKIHILYSKFFDYEGNNFSIGGVETYLLNLSKLLIENKYNVDIYQFANFPFEKDYNGIKVHGIKVNISKYNKAKKELLNYVQKNNKSYDTDILIFGSDYMICQSKFKNTIGIQHGIAWDITSYSKEKNMTNILNIIRQSLGSIKKYNRYSKVKCLVAVDYNFLNWYRTQVKNVNNYIKVIPNFVEKFNENKTSDSNCIRIIFARRFVSYRGTKLFASVIKKIIDSNQYNIKVTIAGEGPDENYLHSTLDGYKEIIFTKFEPNESFSVHCNQDIAVVPTLGSEGTSLSLLEAMGAGCSVIATNIGGMTNIILNRYNGLLIEPNEKQLENAIIELLTNETLRNDLSYKALETTKITFNKLNWDNQWIDVINNILEVK